jgi:hypothetical protein
MLFKQRYDEAFDAAKSERDQAIRRLSIEAESAKRLKDELATLRRLPTTTPLRPSSELALKALHAEKAELEHRAVAAEIEASNNKAELNRLAANLSLQQTALRRTEADRKHEENLRNVAEAAVRARESDLQRSEAARSHVLGQMKAAESTIGLLEAQLSQVGQALAEHKKQLSERVANNLWLQGQVRRHFWFGLLGIVALTCVILVGLIVQYAVKPSNSKVVANRSPEPIERLPVPTRQKDQPQHSAVRQATMDGGAVNARTTADSTVCRIELRDKNSTLEPRHHFKGITVTKSSDILLAASGAAGTEVGNGLLWLSKDKGVSWQRVPDSAYFGYSGLVSMNGNQAIALGTGGILKVTLAEETKTEWFPVKKGEQRPRFSSAVGENLTELLILSSDSGGYVWRVFNEEEPYLSKWLEDDKKGITPGHGDSLYAIAGDSSGLWAVGFGGHISSAHKPNSWPPRQRAWKNWSERDESIKAKRHEMLWAALPEGDHAILCGGVGKDRGVVYKVSEAAANWTRNDLNFPCYAIASLNESNYILAGKQLVLMDKKTGVLTDVTTPCDFGADPIHALSVVSPSQVYVVGDNGLFYKWEKPHAN